MNDKELKQYIGQELLKSGFKTWFLYMFRVINGRPFIVEEIHKDIFDLFEKIHRKEILRHYLNLPPRTAKTTVCQFFIVYCYTINPKCNFIYTSYSQNLLTTIATQIINIFEHPIYKALYPYQGYTTEDKEVNAVDSFWQDYLLNNEEKKNVYTSKKITTYAGGVCWFASIGSQITGIGAGVRGSKEFSGGIFIDDGNKPSDIHSQLLREKTNKYFTETLLTRLNDSYALLFNVQQRLDPEDLTGFLIATYGYKGLVLPLLKEDGTCTVPSQYTPERIEELKKDRSVFLAQYQQQPIPEEGKLIHTEKFNHYTTPPSSFDALYICCDTAFSEKKSADASAFMLMGVKGNNKYILDLYNKRVGFVDLKNDLKSFYLKALQNYGGTTAFSSIYIEAKASGISLIQQLRSEGLPVQEIYPTVHNAELKKDEVRDKYTRWLEVEADVESGYVYVPEVAPWLPEFISQCKAFNGGTQSSKDDICDSFCYCLKVARKYNQPSWEDLARAFEL